MLRYWLLAIRPKTLSVAVVPVLVGGALAWIDQRTLDWLVMGMTLLAAGLIQIGTNLHNDAADFERGADCSATRLGPARVTAQGWLSAAQVKRGAALCFGAALLCGCYLAWVGGWPIVGIGLAAIAAGLAYTGGPRPVAYSSLGELFVWVFFGLAAVTGSYYLQPALGAEDRCWPARCWGCRRRRCWSSTDYRDPDNDRQVGKNTLAVRSGPPRQSNRI